MDVLYQEAIARSIRAAGALVDGDRVRIGRDIIEEALKTRPREFTFHARNPAHNIEIGGNWIAFAPVGGPPNCSDIDRGRRPGTLDDNANFIRLSQFFNCIHTAGGGSVDALDVHASVRHLHIMRNKVRFRQGALRRSRPGARGCSTASRSPAWRAASAASSSCSEPSAYTVINTNSPLKLDVPMAMGIIEMARHNQVCCVHARSRWPAPWRR